MEAEEAIFALSALGQSTRLQVFQLLVKFEPDGLAAGELARLLSVPQNTLSAHFNVLTNAGLVKSERRSRSIIYRTRLDRFEKLLIFLLRDCCSGRVDIRTDVMESVTRQLSVKARGR
jgi:ArsR family transcriptional regulator